MCSNEPSRAYTSYVHKSKLNRVKFDSFNIWTRNDVRTRLVYLMNRARAVHEQLGLFTTLNLIQKKKNIKYHLYNKHYTQVPKKARQLLTL